MKMPLFLDNLSDKEFENFDNHHVNSKIKSENAFLIENLWFRTQEKSNQDASGWKTNKDRRRRVIHSMQYYNTNKVTKQLFLEKIYLYQCLTLPKNELKVFCEKIISAATKNNWVISQSDDEISMYLDDLFIKVLPKNVLQVDMDENRYYPEDYSQLEIYVTDNNSHIDDFTQDYKRIWKLYKRGLRPRGVVGEPIDVTNNLDEILSLFPAQLEIGCGPSIESDIPALDSLHEIFRVQNKYTHQFYWNEEDNFILDIITRTEKKLFECAEMPLKIIKAKPSQSYQIIAQLSKEGMIVGPVFSNNFDKLIEKVNCEEILVRKYEYDEFYPKVEFSSTAKSLLVIGCHADRRQIQLQARANNLKIIYINPEGYFDENTVRLKKIESLKDGDYIIRLTASEALEKLQELFNHEERILTV